MPTEVACESHATRGIPFHCVNTAISCASPGCHHGPRFGSEFIDPFTSRYRLSRLSVCPKRSPIAFGFVILVGNRSLDYQNEWVNLPFRSFIKELHEFLAVFVSEEGVMEIHLGNPRYASE